MFGSTLWLTLATLVGLAAGFAREWLLVDAWGASLRSDAFLVALFLPEAVRMAMATGLFSSAALPLYQKRDAAQRAAWLSALTARVLGTGFAIAGLFYLAAPLWVWLIGPGLSDAGRALAGQSLQLLAWCVPGFLLHALLCIPLQAHARFVLAGMGSLLFNLPPVVYLALQGGQAEPAGLAASCVVGSLLMPLALLPAMRGMGWRPWHVRADDDCGRQLLGRLGPLLASTLASQGLALLERMVASLLGEGAVTWLNFARKLINLPMVALMSLNQVLLGLMGGKSEQERLALLRRGTALATLLTLPVAAGVVGAAEPLIELLLPAQASGGVLAALLGWLSLTLLFAAWNALLARYAYSVGDTRLPLACELAGNALNAVLLLSLPWWLGLKGIALAALLGVVLTGLLLMRRQHLLARLDWRRQWALALALPALALLIPLALPHGWWQLGAATLAGLALLGALAVLLKPWK
ncbi:MULTISPECIES: lipid II flippase MurJ [unclassified Pseudomonas]|uniref:lipid II flippase MurJ n=1 Tax=unclassified Pseudomonas TaxID=196821 RepID=UPI002447ED69|nr:MULTISPECIES: lipid II flippase MurJ [unclassified Pseudomonas]MDG9929988.1 polysaccharide biosynthesis C-terminal domain-containing protein [Pseudomonas sp. GD04042]MDH0483218.1 polysaccharide biosynthesis C-terminal domain-containing protein [Pseudomonas sp. GD04015]MDH0606321.1 polysaccharide biosynthesis C-terminal domain-containing protein [Pseudomonas sp. GD03869]